MKPISSRIATFAATAILCVMTLSPSWAAEPAQSPQARRDQLAKIQEMLGGEPDPLMRLANMEAIVASGDQTQIRLAVRMALASDDKDLRALAFRAYLASARELVFSITLPDAIQKKYDAVRNSPDDLRAFYETRNYEFIRHLHNWNMLLDVNVEKYSIEKNSGVLAEHSNQRNVGDFIVVGDTAKATIFYSGFTCAISVTPTRNLDLVGTLSCANFNAAPRLNISTGMF